MTIRTWVWRHIAVVTLILLGLTATAAAQEEQQGRVFVGNIAGLESIDAKFGAVVADNGRAVAFVASQDAAWNAANSRWFVGQASGGTLTATATDGTAITGTLVGDHVDGTLGGGQWVGTLTRSGVAGLYRARYGDEVQVAIVLPDGSWVGTAWSATTGNLLRTWSSASGVLQQVSRYTVRLQPDPQTPPVELSQVLPYGVTNNDTWANNPWD